MSDSLQTKHEQSLLRKLFDSPFILLILSLLIVFTSYTLWGVLALRGTPTEILP